MPPFGPINRILNWLESRSDAMRLREDLSVNASRDVEYEAAHRRSIYHRQEILQSDLCGCFFCLRTFRPWEIAAWTDEGDTALCPFCRIDSVIGSASGFPLTDEFLRGMNKKWFG